MKSIKDLLITFLEENRGLVVVVFCLPASFLFGMVMNIRAGIYRLFSMLSGSHLERVQKIQAQIRKWNELPLEKRKPLCNSRPNWLSLSTTFFRKEECHCISIPLYQILHLNEEKLTVTVEPYVTVGQITNYLLKKKYVLACTLEISDATCGGLAMGVGMTTHSHKVGLFQETIVSYGVVLSDGSFIDVRADNEHSLLFHCLPWSHGSLAFLVSLELKIIPAKEYIKLQYKPVVGLENYCNQIRYYSGANGSLNNDIPDFLEATVYSRDEAVIILGNFADKKEHSKINYISRWYKPWFYKHVESFLNETLRANGFSGEELVPVKDYLFRHNRSIFWVLEAIIPFCNNSLFRFIFGWMCPPKPAFLKFTTTPKIRAFTFVKQVFQDIVLPMTVLENSIVLSEKLFNIYPVLIYPCKIPNRNPNYGVLRNPTPDQMTMGCDYGMFYDLGVYGVPDAIKQKTFYDPALAMRTMEKFIRESGGYSFLYADIFLTEEEFEEMFDLKWYNKARKQYHSENAFPRLYDKVKPECDILQICNEFVSKNK